jgi:hypothetical protein
LGRALQQEHPRCCPSKHLSDAETRVLAHFPDAQRQGVAATAIRRFTFARAESTADRRHLCLPDHPDYQQIMAVFTAADHPLRARQVCEAMNPTVAPNNINNARPKLKRLADRGILTETEQGVFTQPGP